MIHQTAAFTALARLYWMAWERRDFAASNYYYDLARHMFPEVFASSDEDDEDDEEDEGDDERGKTIIGVGGTNLFIRV